MHTIERELIKVTGYKAPRKFSDREDYLKSLLNSVMKLTDDDFDNLTDEAAAWTNSAVDAHNSKHGTIPDFDEAVASEDDDASDDSEAEDTTEAESDEEVTEDEDGTESEDEASEDEPSEDTVDEPSEDEVKPKTKPVKKAAVAKAKRHAEPPKQIPSKVSPKAKVVVKKPVSDDEDVVVDKWGCMEGSKNGRALAMFEKGATAREVNEEVGGTFYNILKKMAQDGHRLEKEGHIIKITHSKDRVVKKTKA